MRLDIDYGDIIYHQPNNDSFCDMIEGAQYNAALAITGTIKWTSHLKLYKEHDFESLKFRRSFRRPCFLYQLQTTQLPKFQYDLIPKEICTYKTRNHDKIETYYCKTDLFKYSWFPYTIVEWNKFDVIVTNAKSFLFFKNFVKSNL